jgi:hypothetical protein
VADQTFVVGACAPAVQNFFVYCLTKATADPIAFLASGPHPVPAGPRNMWCTAPLFHAAGRSVYERGAGDAVALSPEAAARAGLADRPLDLYEFVPMRVEVLEVAALEAEPATPPPEPPTGTLAAAWWGRTKDRVGTAAPEPDGRPDCCVRVAGVPRDAAIENIVITGPKKGRWEHRPTGRWWRVAFERSDERLDCYFTFYAAGQHAIAVVAGGGRSLPRASFAVPDLAGGGLRAEANAERPNCRVFRQKGTYRVLMPSCLRNLLAGLGHY